MVVASKWNSSKFPGFTLLVVLVSLVFYLTPVTTSWVIYDRELLLQGQIWRLFTGHLVHFSWRHLLFNLSAFAVLGCLLEFRNRGLLLWLITLTALVSSLYFLLFMPEMTKYGGLSGLVSAAVVYLSLSEIRKKTRVRFIWMLILLLFLAKVCYEVYIGEAVFASGNNPDFIVVPSAHIVGAFMAVFIYIYREYRHNDKSTNYNY